MTKQFEELSKPVAWRWRSRTEAIYNLERTEKECAGKGPEAMYSQEYVTALLAALEEKDQRIAELEQKLAALPADWSKDSSLKTWFPFTAERLAELERITDGITQDAIDGGWTARGLSEYAKSLEQRLQQPIKLPAGFSHQDGATHALLGTGDVMISHIKWADAQGIAFAPMPAGKAGVGVNVDADVAGKSSDEIGAVFVVKSTSMQSLEVLKEAVQMAIDGFKVEGE